MEEEFEESSLNLELQRILDMVHNGDMEELLELGQSANSLEYQNPGEFFFQNPFQNPPLANNRSMC